MTRQQQLAIAAYTEGIRRARQEYRTHPTSRVCPHNHPCAWRMGQHAAVQARYRKRGR